MDFTTHLPRFRRQCSADDGTYDEQYLLDLMETAFATVTSMTRRTEDELVAKGGGSFPSALVQAAMMLGAHWYNLHEATDTLRMSPAPYAVETLVRPFRKLSAE
jgi:hypothetical protein